MEQRTCAACGETFTPTNPKQRACPPTNEDRARAKGQPHNKCARKLMNAAQRGRPVVIGKVGQPFNCEQCDKPCMPGSNVAPHASKFCGYDCKAAWHYEHKDGATRRHMDQQRRAARRRAAERRLATAAAGRRGTVTYWTAGPCVECGTGFVSAHPSAVACSDPCQRKQKRRRSRQTRRRKYGHWRAKARAQHHGVEYEPISPSKVFERDGYRCQLCRKPTKRAAKVPDPRAPTVDHIVPVSRGGPHVYSNVQCACFGCNWRKADGAADDQLRLVG